MRTITAPHACRAHAEDARARSGPARSGRPRSDRPRSGRPRSGLAAALVLGLAQILAPISTAAEDPVAPMAPPPRPAALERFVNDSLTDAVLLFDRHFRVAATGQYLDALDLNSDRNGREDGPRLSSIAATGVGLVSLAIGDRIGVIDDAEAKAAFTLDVLLGNVADRRFTADRSKSGWFRHWIDAYTGAPPKWNTEKFSTIDTAILAAGAAIAGEYFADKARREGRQSSAAANRAEALIESVDWPTAIHDVDLATKHLVFYGPEERPSDRVFARPFDEYALLPCIGRVSEARRGVDGPASMLWEKHYAATEEIAMQNFEGVSVLAKPNGSFVSHFTHQFVFYFCRLAGTDPEFVRELQELAEADRRWFRRAAETDPAAGRAGAFPEDLWGLGAGSELVWNETATEVERGRYGVASLAKNPNAMASPAIMAGFLPVSQGPDGRNRALEDLFALSSRGDCAYAHAGLNFLWRCSARDPRLRTSKVQAIDFSTYLFGFAAAHPDIGHRFFTDYAF